MPNATSLFFYATLKKNMSNTEKNKIQEYFDNLILKRIELELNQKYDLTIKQITEIYKGQNKDAVRIYVYLISEYTNFKKKDIAKRIKRHVTTVHDYITTIKKKLTAETETVYYKQNSETIETANNLLKKIEQYKFLLLNN